MGYGGSIPSRGTNINTTGYIMQKKYSTYDKSNSRKRINSISELMEGDKYLILDDTSTYIEGDERSRTHPGHGYPGYTVHSINMLLYYNKEDWEYDIKGRTVLGDKFKAVVMQPIVINTKVEVTINS